MQFPLIDFQQNIDPKNRGRVTKGGILEQPGEERIDKGKERKGKSVCKYLTCFKLTFDCD